MTIGERIKNKRCDLGLTQDEVAKKIGVALQTIFKYENGIISNIPIEKIEKLAKTLQTTPEYLLGWDRHIDSLDRTVLQLYPDFAPNKNHLPLRDSKSNSCVPIESDIENDVIIYSRDGKTVKKKFTKEQMDYLHKFIDSISDDDCDL